MKTDLYVILAVVFVAYTVYQLVNTSIESFRDTGDTFVPKKLVSAEVVQQSLMQLAHQSNGSFLQYLYLLDQDPTYKNVTDVRDISVYLTLKRLSDIRQSKSDVLSC